MKQVKVRPSPELTDEAIALLPEEPDDMWNVYNLLVPGDIVKAETTRVQKAEGVDSMGLGSSGPATSRVVCKLAVSIETTSWDNSVCEVRCKGKIVNETPYASVGQYHTLVLQLDRPLTLEKKDGWDTVSRRLVQESLKQDKDGALATVVMQDGLANICLITNARTILKRRVEHKVPSKRESAKQLSAEIKSFFNQTLDALLLEIDFTTPRPLLLASPGFVAADFKKFISDKAALGERTNRQLVDMANNITVIHSATGHIHALNDILKVKEMATLVRDMRYVREARDMEQFYKMMREEDKRAWYGVSDVVKLVQEGAVGGGGILLVNNSLFRNENPEVRKKYVAVVDKVMADGGDVRILSGEHDSGQRLAILGGIAAILTYPVYDIDDDEDDVQHTVDTDVERPLEGSVI